MTNEIEDEPLFRKVKSRDIALDGGGKSLKFSHLWEVLEIN